jgi:murein DD-endopeptidase MepM/ murein hydrolase activator NlpD
MRHSFFFLPFFLVTLVFLGCGNGDDGGLATAGNVGLAGLAAPAAPPVTLTPLQEQAKRFSIGQDEPLVLESGKVGKGQSLSHLLSPLGVSGQTLHRIATENKDVFDVRRIRPGKEWHLFRSADNQAPQHFAYAISTKAYVVFDLSEDGGARRGTFPTEIRRRFVEGEVSGSLSQTLENSGHSATLALSTAQVYAWTIDFSRIQKGDRFRILYEREWVGDKPVGMPKVLASEFIHRGRNFPAFAFNQGDGMDHFDENGSSLRKAFLKAPVEFSRVSSRFNKRRFHPVLKKVKAHLGTDYAAAHGTPIVSVGDGVVTKASYTKGNGKYVKVRHNGTYTTQYLHMSRRNVKEGQAVRQGDVIGYVGSTGLATGPHVCFRFWKNGEQVDHLREEFPPSTPIHENHTSAFADCVANWLEEMAQLSGDNNPQLAANAP